jgi:Zn-dependent metalloprotease
MTKRFLVAAALALLLPGVPAQVRPAAPSNPPRADIAERLAALGPDAARLRYDVHPESGALRRLTGTLGGTLSLVGADAFARSMDFANRFGPLFDVNDAITLEAPRVHSADADGTARWVGLSQSVHGFLLLGHGLWLQFDEQGRGIASHGVISTSGAALPPPAVTDTAAIATALAHVGATDTPLRGEPTARGIGRATEDGAELLWRVEFVLSESLAPLAVEVRAADGTVARVIENRTTGGGTGTLVYNDITNVFSTGKGKGLGYKSVKDAAKAKEGNVTLSALTDEDIEPAALALDGTLTGRYVQVSDQSAVLLSPKHSFPYADDSYVVISGLIPTYEAFDHVNTYSWMTRMAEFLQKTMGTLPSDECMPVIVNFDNGGSGYVNAYYSPADLDGAGGYDPGFFVFGDFDSVTGDVRDDLSRDPSIVCHEYTHGMVDKGGHNFGNEPLDTPPRAVNEALADYAAATFLKDPRIGYVFMKNSAADISGSGESLRDLESPLTLPDNLWDTVGGSTAMPQEHQAGLIFAAALWRARDGLKSKLADALIFNNLAGWPQSNAEVGFPVVTPGNAGAAYVAYYQQCFVALMDTLLADKKKGAKNAGKLLGAFLAHGITGTGATNNYTMDGTASSKGLKLDFESSFLGSLDEHSVLITLAAGQQLDFSVKGEKKDGTRVDFLFDDDPGDFTYSKPKTVKAGGSSASVKKILVNVSGDYLLTVIKTSSSGGRYKAKLKVK